MSNEKDMMTIHFSETESLEMRILGTFDVDEVEYLALLHEETDDVYLYLYIREGENFKIDQIPEEDFDKVNDAFWAIWDPENKK